MNEAMQFAASATAQTVTGSAGLKWGAVASGLGLLVLLYLATMVASGKGNPWQLVEGADGSASTSKFQWFLWLIVILFGYTALWVLRAEQGNFSALSEVPVNLLTVLGFSTGTAAAAKGITSGYVQSGRVVKAPPHRYPPERRRPEQQRLRPERQRPEQQQRGRSGSGRSGSGRSGTALAGAAAAGAAAARHLGAPQLATAESSRTTAVCRNWRRSRWWDSRLSRSGSSSLP